MSKFTHNGYEFDTEKRYLYGNSLVMVNYQVDYGVASVVACGAFAQASEYTFTIFDNELSTLREVTIGDPVEQKFVPRVGQAVLVSDHEGEYWCIRIFQEMKEGLFYANETPRINTGCLWTYCKPLPEEMK